MQSSLQNQHLITISLRTSPGFLIVTTLDDQVTLRGPGALSVLRSEHDCILYMLITNIPVYDILYKHITYHDSIYITLYGIWNPTDLP